jgi:hypothetical protein
VATNWGPFYNIGKTPDSKYAPIDLKKLSVFDAPAMAQRDTVDPNTQIGAEQLARGLGDFLYNIPAKINDLGRIPQNYEFAGWDKTPFVGPVVSNTHDFLMKTGPEYQATRDKKTGKTAAASSAESFSPTGEFAASPLAMYTAARESGGNYDARNPRSSATGKYQFLDQTWLATVKKHGPEMMLSQFPQYIQQDRSGKYYVTDPKIRQQILDFRTHPQISELGFQAHTGDLVQEMAPVLGRQPTVQELDMGVFLGGKTAALLLKQPPGTPVGAIVGSDAIRANPEMFPRGAATTVAQLMANRGRLGQGGDAMQGRLIAQQSNQLPGPPPDAHPVIPVDFSGAETALAGLKPQGVDQKYIDSQKKLALLSGWASGLSSTQGGIPGMLARMAGGAFQGKLQGNELEHQLQEQARREDLNWKTKGFDLELNKADQRGREANANLKVSDSNADRHWDYKAKVAELGKMDVSPSGLMETTSVTPDGRVVKSVFDIGSELAAFRQSQGLSGFGSSGGGAGKMGLPKSVEDNIEMYRWARQRTEGGAPVETLRSWEPWPRRSLIRRISSISSAATRRSIWLISLSWLLRMAAI